MSTIHRLGNLFSQRRTTLVLAVLALVVAGLATMGRAGAATSEGLECATGSAGQTFDLTARDGYVSTPDGNSIYMWSYALSTGKFQLPGPTLCVVGGHPGDRRPAQQPDRGHLDRLPRADRGEGRRQPRPAPAQRQRLDDVDGAGRRRERRLRDLPVHRREPGHLPLLLGHRRRQAAADGPVRRPGGPARRARRPRQRPARLGLQPRPRVPLRAQRGRPRPAPGGGARTNRSTGRRTAPATT